MPETGKSGVLLVEDDEELRSLFVLLFEGESYKVYQAHDGKEALDILDGNAREIILLISDLGLPNFGGVDVIARARELNPSIKIIGTSGLSGARIRDMVLEAGADAFLSKPFSIKEVMTTVQHVLGLS